MGALLSAALPGYFVFLAISAVTAAIAILAAEASGRVLGTITPAGVRAALPAVTSIGQACDTLERCLRLVRRGVDIDYVGYAGPYELDAAGDPGAARYLVRVFGAGMANVMRGSYSQGFSTITMQLARNVFSDRISRDIDVPGVVGTLMTNKAVEVAFRNKGVKFVRAKVGDRYVLEELKRHSWILGGEGSGHLLVLDRHTTGDGLVSALQVLSACVDSGKTMAQLLADVTLFPQTLINVRLQPGQDWKTNTLLAKETQAVEAELGDAGRVLIRASGTEPLLRVMVEARDATQAQNCAERLAATVRAQVPA